MKTARVRQADLPLNSGGMLALLCAQFLSALADNAVLIAAIAIVKSQGNDNWPLLQAVFVVPFIVLAPFLGFLADRYLKARVMLAGNLLKVVGAAGIIAGLNPFIAYAMIGVGAAVYSPAKYGILSQMFRPQKLVKANGMMEASTIAAILLGVLLGGLLADYSLPLLLYVIVAAYLLAALVNLWIPMLAAEKADQRFEGWSLLQQFWHNSRQLWLDKDARFSLIGTSVFWGSGATLRLMLFAWVPAVLLIDTAQTPANLMGVVSIGIVLGAVLAGVWVSLATVNRALVGGLILGPAILSLAWVTDLNTAMVCMAVVGLSGGLFVVPLNALLQDRGHHSVGTGNALAVQNFFENGMMLLFVGAYNSVKPLVSVNTTLIGFGLLLLVVMSGLALNRCYRYRD